MKMTEQKKLSKGATLIVLSGLVIVFVGCLYTPDWDEEYTKMILWGYGGIQLIIVGMIWELYEHINKLEGKDKDD